MYIAISVGWRWRGNFIVPHLHFCFNQSSCRLQELAKTKTSVQSRYLFCCGLWMFFFCRETKNILSERLLFQQIYPLVLLVCMCIVSVLSQYCLLYCVLMISTQQMREGRAQCLCPHSPSDCTLPHHNITDWSDSSSQSDSIIHTAPFSRLFHSILFLIKVKD